MTTQHSSGAQNPGIPSLHVQIPPDARHARNVRDALIAFSSLYDVDDADIEALLFALGEALANAIEHGAPSDDIEVGIEIDRDVIRARVTDHGAGFAKTPLRLAPLPRGLVERGRGIPIMQRYADQFDVQSIPGHGTVVNLVRYRRDRARDQEHFSAS